MAQPLAVQPLRQGKLRSRVIATIAGRVLLGAPHHTPADLFEALAADTWWRILLGDELDTPQSETTNHGQQPLVLRASSAASGLPGSTFPSSTSRVAFTSG